MEQNNESRPENRQPELLDLAYNIVPEGADYDVFSENTATEIKPSLLYDGISVNNTEKADTNAEKDKANDLPKDESEYDVFSENPDTNPEPSKPVNREYLDILYNGEVDFSEIQVRMTRSDYIANYNRINERYNKEIKKILKNFFWTAVVFAFGLSVLIMIELLQNNTPVEIVPGVIHPIYRILNGFRAGVFVANPVVCGFLLTSIIKNIKKAKTTYKKALKRLEQRKEELMVLGLYDTAN